MSRFSPYQESLRLLATPVNTLRGVGPRVAQLLEKMNLKTVEDLLYTLPLRYEDRREIRRIAQLRDNLTQVFRGEILVAAETVTSRSRRRLYEVIVSDGSGQVSLKWFHYRKPLMQKSFRVGRHALIVGEVKRFGGVREVHHPDVQFVADSSANQSIPDELGNFGRIVPVYPLTQGLHQKTAGKIWQNAVNGYVDKAVSPLPDYLRQKHGLLPLARALRFVHAPPNDVALDDLQEGRNIAHKSLVYDEFFYLELGLALKRRGVRFEPGRAFSVSHRYTKPLADMLPYRLTNAQRRVLGEIKQDLMKPHPMNRLLQGDVGSGKTIVALMAALLAVENDCQVAVVAPTEILAEQHFQQFSFWLDKLGLAVRLLTGSTPTRERKVILQELREGTLPIVVGTHAVLQEGVEFHRLGLGIVDEQHRFGVRQRGVLRQQEIKPHILVMTATPIPRTLSLTLYGDLTLSVIDELPPGRTPIQTRVITETARERAVNFIRKELAAGHQAYIVYPLVEETEKSDLKAASEAAELLAREAFADFKVGLLHGRMKAEEKEQVMAAFKAGDIHILVSTTVIEVGVDVPNATVMMIEHAERFGLAQLHQLRGRVGRGGQQSYCLLVKSRQCSADGQRRLEVMAETTDGFRIAEEDLALRGPGEFLGTRQSGVPDFRIANLLRDGSILEQARQDAMALIEKPEFFNSPDYAELRQALLDRWGSRLELASIG